MAAGDPIDYTSYYASIATALGTIATNSTDIKTSLATIATQTTTLAAQTTILATKLGEIESHQKKLKELGEGAGIHVVSPYEWISVYSIYKSLLAQGITDFASLKAQVGTLPKEF